MWAPVCVSLAYHSTSSSIALYLMAQYVTSRVSVLSCRPALLVKEEPSRESYCTLRCVQTARPEPRTQNVSPFADTVSK